eukprot:TRINITY_DN4419_c0_g3_i4.p1 TRINITY_DN4419_c0_g3~~TRINITY_DN4419_c0_g3_i4.p1  ORF type:complete len:188 (-),score=32.80 TRINITY_DN4419_c0_g3_i4:742-1305(-)
MCIRDRYMGKEQRSTQFHARIFQEEGEKMLSSFRDRALHLKLHGIINPEMTEKVNFALRKKWFYNIQLIAVSINSPKGSIVQAKNIANALRNYSRDTNAPLYTFAEDVVFGAGNSILACGNKVFASEQHIRKKWCSVTSDLQCLISQMSTLLLEAGDSLGLASDSKTSLSTGRSNKSSFMQERTRSD